jgi:hypothetical protein
MIKPKTSSVILEILEILIQNQVLPVNLYWDLSGKSNHLRINITPKVKTSTLILEIL